MTLEKINVQKKYVIGRNLHDETTTAAPGKLDWV